MSLFLSRAAPAALLAASALLAACATPAPLRGGNFADVTPQQAVHQKLTSQRVRWGGGVLSTSNTQQESCFEVLGKPLDGATRRPRLTDRDEGRFLACYPGFKDPQVYKPGREVTVTGTITGYETRKVDAFEYTYPKVAADEIYLWPERKDPPDVHHDPFFYPHPYYYYYPHYYRPAYRSSAPAPAPAVKTPRPQPTERERLLPPVPDPTDSLLGG